MFHDFLTHIIPRFTLSYRKGFWIFHSIAIVVTIVLVMSGFDWYFFEITRASFFSPIIMIAGAGGFFLPLILPFMLYEWGRRKKDETYRKRAVAVFQASVIVWIIVACYKAITGRVEPPIVSIDLFADNSRQFQFGFFRHGIFWGWPSHHTAVAVAMGTVLIKSMQSLSARVVVFLWVIIVAFGASVGFHWLSDVVAGALIGYAVGSSVWQSICYSRE